ncbi:hypothetical protein EYF80_048349 [Liparis tanakae]|uniref:Uncharacterized protein n=1 Tax=Liparis tanakae TaxID=230148 RepID=A0A4Z2FKG9_9TELE|nr:hypothetical protein EYF80_048349 [Liparis tanakae]
MSCRKSLRMKPEMFPEMGTLPRWGDALEEEGHGGVLQGGPLLRGEPSLPRRREGVAGPRRLRLWRRRPGRRPGAQRLTAETGAGAGAGVAQQEEQRRPQRVHLRPA